MSRKRIVPDVICSCCGKQYHPHYMKQALDNGHRENITLNGLIMRDKNTCHICGRKCDKNDCSRIDGTFIVGKMYPSVDHVVPLCSGGTHTWSNVMLAHVSCNSRKGRNNTPPGHPG